MLFLLLLLSTLTVYVQCLALATTGIDHFEFDTGTCCITPIIPTLVTITMITTTCSYCGSSLFACSNVCVRPITAMSSSTMRPCELQRVFAVKGGGINEDEEAWVIMPTSVDEKLFGCISMDDKGCKRFVCKNFKMVHHLMHLRNQKVQELMVGLGGMLPFPRRDVYESLPSILSVDAAHGKWVTSVNVLRSWDVNDVLQMQINSLNLSVLMEEPPVETAPWTPTFVRFPHPVSQIIEFSLDGASVRVEFPRDMDDDAKRDAVMGAAADFKERYCRFYNAENPRPGQQPFNNERESFHSSRGVNHIYRQS